MSLCCLVLERCIRISVVVLLEIELELVVVIVLFLWNVGFRVGILFSWVFGGCLLLFIRCLVLLVVIVSGMILVWKCLLCMVCCVWVSEVMVNLFCVLWVKL